MVTAEGTGRWEPLRLVRGIWLPALKLKQHEKDWDKAKRVSMEMNYHFTSGKTDKLQPKSGGTHKNRIIRPMSPLEVKAAQLGHTFCLPVDTLFLKCTYVKVK